MTDKVRQMAPVIWEEIEKANNILLHCHPSPDGDSIGSSLAMAHMLRAKGKNMTHIIGDSVKPKSLQKLPGFETIEEKNFFDIDLAKIDLFIIMDSGGIDQISKKGEIVFPETLRTVNIDHHLSNNGYAEINLVDPSYGALGQMIYDLFDLWKIQITPEIAANLFIGIYTDTQFKYPRTNSETFRIAGELAKIYPDFPALIFEIENNEEPEQIAFLGLSLNSVEHYFGNKVALSAVSNKQLKEKGILKRHTEKTDIPNILKSVVGWDIGIRFTEIEPGIVSISFRGRHPEKWDLSKIAKATGMGGGHPAAAGASIRMPFDDAKKFLLKTIQEVYPELGQP